MYEYEYWVYVNKFRLPSQPLGREPSPSQYRGLRAGICGSLALELPFGRSIVAPAAAAAGTRVHADRALLISLVLPVDRLRPHWQRSSRAQHIFHENVQLEMVSKGPAEEAFDKEPGSQGHTAQPLFDRATDTELF